MAGEDHRIEVEVDLRNELTPEAEVVAKSIDDVGDQALQTSAELKVMGEAADSAGDDFDSLSAKSAKLEARLKRQKGAISKTEGELESYRKKIAGASEDNDHLAHSVQNVDNWFKRLFNRVRGNNTSR